MHMGFGCKPYTNAKCKLSCQFLSNCKDLNDLLTVYLMQATCKKGAETWQVESGTSLFVLRMKPAAQNEKMSAREPAWIKSPVTVIHCFILFSLSLYLPSASQQLHHLIPFSAVLQFLWDGLLLSEREERELHDLKAWENDIENILPSAKFHVPEDITPMQ